MATSLTRKLTKVLKDSLFVSEPDPRAFGNTKNEDPNVNWLKSRFHFSFAEYHDNSRDQFGCIRVINDDLVQAKRGFGAHPHSNMEIVTYVINGYLTHKDSLNTSETLGPNSIQFMTAGTGIQHSEHNLHEKESLRFYQIWILPRQRGLKPNYGSLNGDEIREKLKNNWVHLVSDTLNTQIQTPVKINQDCNIHAVILEPTKQAELRTSPSRKTYFLCAEGQIEIEFPDQGQESIKLEQHDAFRAENFNHFIVKNLSSLNSHAVLLDIQ